MAQDYHDGNILSLLLQSDMAFGMQGLERLAEYDYVAIFDADFKPDADFLVGHG